MYLISYLLNILFDNKKISIDTANIKKLFSPFLKECMCSEKDISLLVSLSLKSRLPTKAPVHKVGILIIILIIKQ